VPAEGDPNLPREIAPARKNFKGAVNFDPQEAVAVGASCRLILDPSHERAGPHTGPPPGAPELPADGTRLGPRNEK
jgi:hypothetical protein